MKEKRMNLTDRLNKMGFSLCIKWLNLYVCNGWFSLQPSIAIAGILAGAGKLAAAMISGRRWANDSHFHWLFSTMSAAAMSRWSSGTRAFAPYSPQYDSVFSRKLETSSEQNNLVLKIAKILCKGKTTDTTTDWVCQKIRKIFETEQFSLKNHRRISSTIVPFPSQNNGLD